MRVFSNRYLKAIYEKKLTVIIPARLRKRLWLLLEAHNTSIGVQRDPGDRWITNSSTIEETFNTLRLATGGNTLQARLPNGDRGTVDTLEAFFDGCYPSQVLDTVEAFWHHLAGFDTQEPFADAVNEMFEDASCPWRIDSGEFFAVDQTFMGLRLAQAAEQNLAAKSFRGAHGEFRKAREDLLAGDTKGCISNAHKAFESALKTLLGVQSGNASALIRKFVASAHVDGLPAEFRVPFGEQVLMSLPTLSNKLGRHGQGSEVVHVPEPFARLSLELAAAYLNFLVKLRPDTPEPPVTAEITDDDIPF